MEKDLIIADILSWNKIMVTPSTLFKKKDYRYLTNEEQWQKALDEGWRFDMSFNKFYKLVKER